MIEQDNISNSLDSVVRDFVSRLGFVVMNSDKYEQLRDEAIEKQRQKVRLEIYAYSTLSTCAAISFFCALFALIVVFISFVGASLYFFNDNMSGFINPPTNSLPTYDII